MLYIVHFRENNLAKEVKRRRLDHSKLSFKHNVLFFW